MTHSTTQRGKRESLYEYQYLGQYLDAIAAGGLTVDFKSFTQIEFSVTVHNITGVGDVLCSLSLQEFCTHTEGHKVLLVFIDVYVFEG